MKTMVNKNVRPKKRPQILLHFISLLFALSIIIPVLVVISASFTSEAQLAEKGFGIWPAKFDLSAYEYIFANPNTILRSYVVTIAVTLITTVAGVGVMLMTGYVIARNNCKFRKGLTFYLFFTMLFSGGIVPSYILITQYLHMKNTYLVMILPALISPWYIIMIRTFIQDLPAALFESLKIDGAGEFRIFQSIVVPLSKPVIATVAFFVARSKWNDWSTGLYYLTDESKFPLQYLLYKIQNDLQSLLVTMVNDPWINMDLKDIPGTNLLMAMAVLATGPMLIIFPVFQKHFVHGLTVGAVKG